MKLAYFLLGSALLAICLMPVSVSARGGGGGGGGGGHGGHGGGGHYGGHYGGFGYGGYGLGLGLGYGLGYGYGGYGYGYPLASGGYGGYGYPYPAAYPGYAPGYQLPLTPYYPDGQFPPPGGPGGPVPPMPPAATVHLEVVVPSPQARVWVDGQLTSATGTDRSYVTSPLQKGYSYAYTLRAAWDQGGQQITVERNVQVTPGQTIRVDFTNQQFQAGSATPPPPPS